MLSFSTSFVAAVLAAGVLAAPTVVEKRNTPNAQGTSGGYFYQFWDDGSSGNTVYTNGNNGEYSVNWQDVGDFTAGKGWKTAEPRTINFSGDITSSGNFYLAIYTWDQHGENYILENYGDYNPCVAGTNIGSIYSDGSEYEYCLVNRGGGFFQNWSVRKNKRSSGTVTTANHYNYYAAHGGYNPISEADYQILSTESFGGASGSASMTVSEASSNGAQSAASSNAAQPAAASSTAPESAAVSSTAPESAAVSSTAPESAAVSSTAPEEAEPSETGCEEETTTLAPSPATSTSAVPTTSALATSTSDSASIPASSPTGSSGTCVGLYGRCGGQGYTGPTCCSVGTCQVANPWYSQCMD